MYKALYKPNQLIYGFGEPVIVTGWSPAKKIANQLKESDYAAIGQLYSPKRGINFLIRNLLFNPQVTDLIILNATKEDWNAGACQCLNDFFHNGFYKISNRDNGKDYWRIDSEVEGYIDIEVEKEAIESIRESVKHYFCRSIEMVKHSISIAKERNVASTRKSRWTFPVIEADSATTPSSIYGQTVTGKTIAETWVKIIQRIRTNGILRPTGYDGQWQELQVLTAVVTDEPEDFYFPEPNYLPCDRQFIENYIPQILSDAPYEKGVKYTYGQRLRSWFGKDQIEEVIHKLVHEPDAASGVMSLWDSGSGGGRESISYAIARYGRGLNDSDHNHGGSPCLNHIWVRIADDKMTLAATFRSNDMFSAWPSNAMGLRVLQRYILEQVNARGIFEFKLGPLITVSDSAHIYDDCWENADNLIKNQYYKILNNRDYYDPSGNFVVSVENSEIVVEWLTPENNLIKVFRNKKSMALRRMVAIDCPTLSVENALYLGDRLQWAENQIAVERSSKMG